MVVLPKKTHREANEHISSFEKVPESSKAWKSLHHHSLTARPHRTAVETAKKKRSRECPLDLVQLTHDQYDNHDPAE